MVRWVGGWVLKIKRRLGGWLVWVGLVRLLRWLGWVGHEPSAVPVGGCCE